MDTLTQADLATATEAVPTIKLLHNGKWVGLPKQFVVRSVQAKDGEVFHQVVNRVEPGDHEGEVELSTPVWANATGEVITLTTRTEVCYFAEMRETIECKWSWRGDDLDVWVYAKPHAKVEGGKVTWLTLVPLSPHARNYKQICDTIRSQHASTKPEPKYERSFKELGHGTYGRRP